ncbi:G2 and S phase-expressed protein 1 [Otolemur garnettii]|uniref:G2 and S phase-expressed protein 1 n=1 Tax=Otolemur garnettii TaxID=30611 RepID=UPI0006443F25|nr:G2 and S phase-expressed protein 1 [Otolemur garnettii]
MDAPGKEDIRLLADEKFDFDLSLSSSSANEDDEVFFGPIGHKERCIAASLELNSQRPESRFPWSPLAGEKFVEVYKEAHLLALQIESSSRNKVAQAAAPQDPCSQDAEWFIQESKSKINLFEKEKEMKKSPKSLKRETYYLSESPIMGPPLSGVWPPRSEPPLPDSSLVPLSSPAQAGLAQTQGPRHPSRPLPGESRTAHPPTQAVTQRKITSKLQPPRASSIRGRHVHLAVEKTKKEIPASPSRTKTVSGKECPRDVLPDRPALGAASGSHLVQGKRSLPVPSKLGLKQTLLKPPSCAGNLARKSSLGSVLSGASSLSASPAGGKAKSSEFSIIPTSSSQPVSNSSMSGRAGPVALQRSLRAGPAGTLTGPAKSVDVEPAAEQPTMPTTACPTQPQTPDGGGRGLDSTSILSESSQLNKTRSIRRQDAKTKVMPTPTGQFKIPKFSIGESPDSSTPKCLPAQRPQPRTSVGRVIVHSTPIRPSLGPATHNLSSVGTPVSMTRRSAMPTPASRRLSSLPLLAPKSMPRAVASPPCVVARRLSSEPRKKSAVRTEGTREDDRRADAGQEDLSLDRSLSPPSSVPQALNFSPEKSDVSFSKIITTAGTPDEAKPSEDAAPSEALLIDVRLDLLTATPRVESAALADPPLIDLGSTPEAGAPTGPESRPLIDLLINTPDMNKDVMVKPLQAAAQLIDLGLPLILLSPEADKENVESPLLKF